MTSQPQERILPLAEPVLFYKDQGEESREVKRLLGEARIVAFEAEREVSPQYRRPLVLHHGGFYQGLDEIAEWLAFLRFLGRTRPESPTFAQDSGQRSA